MTKSQLIVQIAEEAKLSKGRAEAVVNAVFDAMIDALKRDEGVEIRGFGTFTVRHYKPYKGRNPRTGAAVHVGPKRLPYFKVGKELRERINGERGGTPESPRETTRAPATTTTRTRTPRVREEDLSEDVI